VSECDREASTVRRPWPTRGCRAIGRKEKLRFIAIFFEKGPAARCYGRTAALRLIVRPCDEDEEKDQFFFSFFRVTEQLWNEIDRGKPKYSGGKTCSSTILSTTNPTWTDLGSNPDLRGERPATNRLSHGKALLRVTLMCSMHVTSCYLFVYHMKIQINLNYDHEQIGK
jgi:hypothetical protein